MDVAFEGPLADVTALLAAWGLSAAKHSGSYDALLAIHDPAEHLLRVQLPDETIDQGPAALAAAGERAAEVRP